MTRSPAEMAEGLERQAWSKREWLNTFSSGRKKWPEHDIQQKRDDLDILLQAAAYIRARAAERAA